MLLVGSVLKRSREARPKFACMRTCVDSRSCIYYVRSAWNHYSFRVLCPRTQEQMRECDVIKLVSLRNRYSLTSSCELGAFDQRLVFGQLELRLFFYLDHDSSFMTFKKTLICIFIHLYGEVKLLWSTLTTLVTLFACIYWQHITWQIMDFSFSLVSVSMSRVILLN